MSTVPAFFLGANTPRGFVSLVPELAREPGLRLSALKAGPGCGKSTFLRSLNLMEEPTGGEIGKIYTAYGAGVVCENLITGGTVESIKCELGDVIVDL